MLSMSVASFSLCRLWNYSTEHGVHMGRGKAESH